MTQQGTELNPVANTVLQDDTYEGSDPIARKALMLDTYTEAIGDEKNENTQRCINEALWGTILPKKKFVDEGDGFGRFDRPDFRDSKNWVSILYKKIPSLDLLSDRMKCKVWITYRKKIKEQFSLHRSAITLKIQKAFVDGKSDGLSLYNPIFKQRTNLRQT